MAKSRYQTKKIKDITETIQKLVNDISKGKIDNQTANLIFRGIDLQVKALKALDQEMRIEEIEEQLEIRERGEISKWED